MTDLVIVGMKLCPGFPSGSCMTWIERGRFLCGFCSRTLLRQAA